MEARKCPHCHHFQNRVSMLLFHPAVAVLFAALPMAALLVGFVMIFDTGEDYEDYKDQIVISDSELAFGETKSGATVAVMGTIKNTSSVAWNEIRFHAEFLDAAGRRVDVGQKEEYSFYLPPRGTSSFKVSFQRSLPETNYVKHSIRVVAAKDAKARW